MRLALVLLYFVVSSLRVRVLYIYTFKKTGVIVVVIFIK